MPFYSRWEKTQLQAAQNSGWELAKTSFSALTLELLMSPDLTETQKSVLTKEYRGRIKELRDLARDTIKMGVEYRNAETVFVGGDEIHNLHDFLDSLD